MPRFVCVLSILLMVAGCTQPSPLVVSSDPKAAPFVGLGSATLSDGERKIIMEASDDFLSVVAGKKPIHASVDEDAALPADGGTTYYNGNGYKLTLVKNLSSFGEFDGYAYGPALTFNEDSALGNIPTISDIRIYSNVELRRLLGDPNGR